MLKNIDMKKIINKIVTLKLIIIKKEIINNIINNLVRAVIIGTKIHKLVALSQLKHSLIIR